MKALFPSLVVLSLAVINGGQLEAAVVGEKAVSLGTDQKSMTWKSWLGTPDAVITSEAMHLATQACVRSSQRSQDVLAYPQLRQLNEELSLSLQNSPEKFGAGILALTELVREIEALDFERFAQPESYEPQCRKVVEKHLVGGRDKLDVIFSGRLRPQIPEVLAKRGLELAPMTWESLASQTCQLQGYYSIVSDPNLWKFYSISILYQSVLPAESDDAEFTAAVLLSTQGTRTFELLNRLARYSAVAGNPNGPTLAYRSLWRAGLPRTTGSATGSRAHSLLPTYSTPWREALQNLIVTRPYDDKTPFQLLKLEEIFFAGNDPARTETSAAEQGMQTVFRSLGTPDAQASLLNYRKTAALAWLAMNAETNVRQNEKLAGAVASAAQKIVPTPHVWGDPKAYEAISKEIETVLTAFQAVAAADFKVPRCLKGISDFLAEAAKIPQDQVGTTSEPTRLNLLGVQIEPIAVSLGLEVVDAQDGKFYVNLATGQGRAFELSLGGKTYLVWTPSAYLLHLKTELTTAGWQEPAPQK